MTTLNEFKKVIGFIFTDYFKPYNFYTLIVNTKYHLLFEYCLNTKSLSK